MVIAYSEDVCKPRKSQFAAVIGFIQVVLGLVSHGIDVQVNFALLIFAYIHCIP